MLDKLLPTERGCAPQRQETLVHAFIVDAMKAITGTNCGRFVRDP
jgi:hypothetical protein